MVSLHLIIVEDLELDQENLKKLIQKDCDISHETVNFSCYKNGEVHCFMTDITIFLN